MQTILKIVCDNRGVGRMVDDFILRFCEKATGEGPVFDIPAGWGDNVAFAKDDCGERPEGSLAGRGTKPGSFGPHPTQVNESTKFIFVNPVIVSYRPTRHRLCVWIGSPPAEENSGSE